MVTNIIKINIAIFNKLKFKYENCVGSKQDQIIKPCCTLVPYVQLLSLEQTEIKSVKKHNLTNPNNLSSNVC